ncbi:MAG: antibiotic biosynthesis monooxygenase [Novosphingobium sp.]|nr:antibiotic biosynthesis monooxygenase [Novosphingobium sp.]
MPIGVMLTITAKAGSREEMHSRLLDAVAMSRTEPGNLVSVLMADPENDHRFSIFEIYRDKAAIAEHQAADYTKESAPIIHGMFGAPMEVKYLDTLNWPQDMRVMFAGEQRQ